MKEIFITAIIEFTSEKKELKLATHCMFMYIKN